jgi:hypothetical protein
MSARSYAYRNDLSAHDAIAYVASEFSTEERLFVAEYDFSKFFDSISHEYLLNTIASNKVLASPSEMQVIQAFMEAPYQDEATYSKVAAPKAELVGIPQGTSVSLFLANVAALELDRALERLGVSFVRYADDTLIWSRDHAHLSQAVNQLKLASERIGAKLNPKKSAGIRLFVPPGEKAEITPTDTVSFVGYRFMRNHIGLKPEVIDRMKRRIIRLVWENLFAALEAGTFKIDRILPDVDRDYLVLIMQIRRYLYGNLTEEQVRNLEHGEVKQIRFPGVMSYFPLVDDLEQLQAFDGWLVATLHNALRKRARMIRSLGAKHLPRPHGLRRASLISAEAFRSDGARVDLRIPSIARFASVVRRSALVFGPNRVGRGVGAEQYQYMS